MSHTEAVQQSDISFIIVPTPSDDRGAFSLQYAAYAFKALGQALKQKEGYHVFVLTSTVLPGSTRHGLLPILEQESGKKCGVDFGMCYSPEFIALGSVIRDFLNPDFYLVGEFDQRSGDLLEAVNSIVSVNHAPCKRMTIENAERTSALGADTSPAALVSGDRVFRVTMSLLRSLAALSGWSATCWAAMTATTAPCRHGSLRSSGPIFLLPAARWRCSASPTNPFRT